MTKGKAEIRAIIANHAKALSAKNADLLFAHNSPDFTSFDLAPPLSTKAMRRTRGRTPKHGSPPGKAPSAGKTVTWR